MENEYTDASSRKSENKENTKNAHVADVRRSLAHIRSLWEQQTLEQPMFIGDKICDNAPQTITEFSFQFVLSHHSRRGRVHR